MVTRPEELGHPDLIILPGSRCTAAALRSLRSNGLEKSIKEEVRREGSGDILGICGGMQMMEPVWPIPRGWRIPPAMWKRRSGLLPLETTLGEHKILRRSAAEDLVLGLPLSVYEIHHGKTETTPSLSSPVEGRSEGAAAPDLDGKS